MEAVELLLEAFLGGFPGIDGAAQATGRCGGGTRQLSRAGFERAIEIRQLQVANDQHALREWRNALRQADRFWAANPDWTFGDCLDAILAQGSAATLVMEAAQ